MNIFLSYASEDREAAESITLALQGEGHEVFFDREDLAAGDDYHSFIRRRIQGADRFLFLISPQSVEEGSYALTELKIARERWTHPAQRVIPVLLRTTPMDRIPPYLRAVTIFEPTGNVAGELAAHLAKRTPWVRVTIAMAALVAVGVTSVIAFGRAGEEPRFEPQVAASDFVSRYVYDPDDVERTEYSLDPTSPLAPAGEGFLALRRLAFGTVSDTVGAFSVHVTLRNDTDRPIALDISHRFFELADDQGRAADLLFFCCPASEGDVLSPGEERELHFIYANASWYGKEVAASVVFH